MFFSGSHNMLTAQQHPKLIASNVPLPGVIQPIAYEDVKHVRITKAFLSDPEKFLRHL
jgi:predicted ATPase